MQSTLVDTGIIVALLSRNDRFHAQAVELLRQYEGQSCDFADASLVYAAWRTGVREIWTIDEDFRIYRLPDKSRFKVIPSPG